MPAAKGAAPAPSDRARPDRRIEDYALIGDCETAALVGRDGSIDWLCWPRFDTSACFAALLGDDGNGRWRIAPEGLSVTVSRAYRPQTLVLDTRFETPDGVVVLTDFMPMGSNAPRLLRQVRCLSGKVTLRSRMSLRFDYGRLKPWTRRNGKGAAAIAGPHAAQLTAEGPGLADCPAEGDQTFTLEAGETARFELSYFASYQDAAEPLDFDRALEEAERYWRRWVGRSDYAGPWRGQVERSLMVLKALTYAPSGGILAAPTSSLPELAGGSRNWDYRFCWLRDATFTLMSLMEAGYRDEAQAWRDWLLRAAAGEPDKLQPLYGVLGAHRLMEWEADWLAGFGGARPVRFGNAAAFQRQLDIYGEVIDALFQAARRGVQVNDDEWRLVRAMVDHVVESWRKPDRGIWEVRGHARRFTHSQVMAWVAVDRGLRLAKRAGMEAPVERWRKAWEAIRSDVLEHCFDPQRNTFVQAAGADDLDAATLMIPLVGFLPPDDPKVVGTREAIGRELMHEGFVRRYRTEGAADGLGQGEAAFLACSFWYVDNLALQGKRQEAEAMFERLVGLANDVGLLAEEYEPDTGRLMGNFPQALSHYTLVNSAFNLSGAGPAHKRAER